MSGTQLACPNCKSGLRQGVKFCGACGSRIQQDQAPVGDFEAVSGKAKQVLSSWRQSIQDFAEAQSEERERRRGERIVQEQREQMEQYGQKLISSIEAAEGFFTSVRQEVESISADWGRIERQHFGGNFAADSISTYLDRCDATALDALRAIQDFESSTENQVETSALVSRTESVVEDLRGQLKESVENLKSFDAELAKIVDWFSEYSTSAGLTDIYLLIGDAENFSSVDGYEQTKNFRAHFQSKLSELQPYIVGYDILAQERTSGSHDNVNTHLQGELNFFRCANSVSYTFLERLSSSDSKIGKRIVPVSLMIAYEASAEGLNLLEHESQVSLDSSRHTDQIRRLHAATKQHLQNFFYVLQQEVGRENAQDRDLLKAYGTLTYALTLERYETFTNMEAVSYDLHRHEAAGEILSLHRRLFSYNLFFRVALEGIDKYVSWWGQYEVKIFGHKGVSPIVGDLHNAKAQAQSGHELSLEKILSQEWSLDTSKHDTESALLNLDTQQSEDTNNNVLLSLMRFNTGLSSLQGLDRYKEEFEKFLRSVSRHHPAMATHVAMQFPDPDGPTELDRLQVQIKDLEQANSTLRLERDRLQNELQSLRASNQAEIQQLNQTMQRMEQMQIDEHKRERTERIMKAFKSH